MSSPAAFQQKCAEHRGARKRAGDFMVLSFRWFSYVGESPNVQLPTSLQNRPKNVSFVSERVSPSTKKGGPKAAPVCPTARVAGCRCRDRECSTCCCRRRS